MVKIYLQNPWTTVHTVVKRENKNQISMKPQRMGECLWPLEPRQWLTFQILDRNSDSWQLTARVTCFSSTLIRTTVIAFYLSQLSSVCLFVCLDGQHCPLVTYKDNLKNAPFPFTETRFSVVLGVTGLFLKVICWLKQWYGKPFNWLSWWSVNKHLNFE